MRFISLILLYILPKPIFGQVEFRGRVVDSSGIGLQYVNIALTNGRSGTITDSAGFFDLPGVFENDTIQISHIGYITRVMPVRLLHLNEIVVLSVLHSSLGEVEIRNWNTYRTLIKHGFSSYKSNGYIGLVSGSQLAVFIKNPENREGWIKRIYIPIYRTTPCADLFRVRVLIGDEIIGPSKVIYFSEKPILAKQINKAIWIDVSESRVLFPKEGCFIAFEVLSESFGCDISLQTAISSTMAHPSIVTWSNYRDLRWTKSQRILYNQKTLTPRMSIEVGYTKKNL
jgi:hypothetical protein